MKDLLEIILTQADGQSTYEHYEHIIVYCPPDHTYNTLISQLYVFGKANTLLRLLRIGRV